MFQRKKSSYRFPRAFTLVEILFTMLIIGVLLAIAVPSFLRARSTARQKTCLKNLTLILAAKEQWAMDFRRSPTDTPIWPDDLVAADRYIKGSVPVCPTTGATYVPNAINVLPQCGSPSASTGPDMSGITHVLTP
jgi:prepilin-type N-terminal cleavage/methylation domain-containing protein